MRHEFAKSLHLHRAVARKVDADFEGEVAKACDFPDHHRASHSPHSWWLQGWDRILSEYDKLGLLSLLVSETDYACDLRSSSPFTRALTPREHYDVLQNFPSAGTTNHEAIVKPTPHTALLYGVMATMRRATCMSTRRPAIDDPTQALNWSAQQRRGPTLEPLQRPLHSWLTHQKAELRYPH